LSTAAFEGIIFAAEVAGSIEGSTTSSAQVGVSKPQQTRASQFVTDSTPLFILFFVSAHFLILPYSAL
jgi:hypothetical protein